MAKRKQFDFLGPGTSKFQWNPHKDKVQQGALFNMKPSNRWSRGYTPERRKEIIRNLPKISVQPMSDIGNENPIDQSIRVARNAPLRDVWAGDAEAIANTVARRVPKGGERRQVARSLQEVEQAVRTAQEKVARSRLIDSMARSRINPSVLSGVNEISIGSSGSMFGPPAGASGNYSTMQNKIELEYARRGRRGEATLFHELGHAADDDIRNRKVYLAEGDVVLQSGHSVPIFAEGKADGFREANFVPRKNEKTWKRAPEAHSYADYEYTHVLDKSINPIPEKGRIADNPIYQQGVYAGSGRTIDRRRRTPVLGQQLRLFKDNEATWDERTESIVPPKEFGPFQYLPDSV